MKVLRIFTVLLLIAFLFNYFTRKKLPFAHADVADYNLLYTTSDNIYIKKLGVINDSLDILFGGNVKDVNRYTVSWHNSRPGNGTDSGILSTTGKSLRYKPPPSKPQVIEVRLNDDTCSWSMNVSYTPEEVYRQAGNSSTLEYEVTSAGIAVEPSVVREVLDWTPENWTQDKRIPFSSVQNFLADSAGIQKNETTVQKILKIGRIVLGKMPPDYGLPSDTVSALHPLQQLQQAKAGRVNLWCGNYVAIFGCLASAADIPNRIVLVGGAKKNLGLGNHVFCEAYLKEEKQWVYVDLTNNTILLQQGNRYLNVIDLQRLLRYPGGTDQVNCFTAAGDSINIVPFNTRSMNARYYFHQNTLFTFFYKDYNAKYSNPSLLQRIKNLFLTRPMYAVYSDNLPGRNYHFQARIFSNYLLAAVAVAWFLLLLRTIIRSLRKRRVHQ
jgi:hypothetical protein